MNNYLSLKRRGLTKRIIFSFLSFKGEALNLNYSVNFNMRLDISLAFTQMILTDMILLGLNLHFQSKENLLDVSFNCPYY